MTIEKVIEDCDRLKPNQYVADEKIGWLSDLDGMIKRELIDTHEGGSLILYSPYNASTALSTVLLVPNPYSDMYIKYLFAQIDFNNAEFTRYNNDMMMYNAAYTTYAQYYNRTNMPLQPNTLKF